MKLFMELLQARSRVNTTIRVFVLSFCFVVGNIFPIGQPALAQVAESSPLKFIEDVIIGLKSFVKERKGSMSAEEMDRELDNRVRPLFDFDEMSRRSLGPIWNQVSAAEQKEFVDLFGELLARTYLARIRNNIADSEFHFEKEKIRDDIAIVESTVTIEGERLSFGYRLKQVNGKWHVYDVVIENIGIVSNYRNEFATVVRKEGFQGLLAKLRKKEIAVSAVEALNK